MDKIVVLADRDPANAQAAAKTLANVGYRAQAETVDIADRDGVRRLVALATDLGDITGVVHAAGVSPSQAPPETVLRVDLYGTALVLEEFGAVVAPAGRASSSPPSPATGSRRCPRIRTGRSR